MQIDLIEKNVHSFKNTYGYGTYSLLLQLSVPYAFTTDLAFNLRLNFSRNIDGNSLDVPQEAVYFIVNSNMVEEVSDQLFQITPSYRKVFLQKLETSEEFGKSRIEKVSSFIVSYLVRRISLGKHPSSYYSVNAWSAFCYIKPVESKEILLESIKKLIKEEDVNGLSQLSLFLSSISSLTSDLDVVKVYIDGFTDYFTGNTESAESKFSSIYDQIIDSKSADLYIPQSVVDNITLRFKHEEVWANCLKIIRDNVGLQSFKTWFEPIVPLSLKDNVITIQVPSQFFFEWLEEHYVSLLRKTIKRELGADARLEYRIVVENSSRGTSSPNTTQYPSYDTGKNKNPDVAAPLEMGTVNNPFIIPNLKKVRIESQLSPNYSFENFVESDANRLAYSAGYAVSSKPPGVTAFNPLVLYGPVGLGKTHLAQAIGNNYKKSFPNKEVLYVSSEKFTNQFINALKNNTVNDFIHFYQLIDVLIVDDIQFFAYKDKTQDIFFHIFNHLHQAGKQLILTSDRAPRDLEGMEERLLSRFKWGLSADLQTPDFETRIAILEKKMYADGIELPREVVEFVAYNINTNIRELEGALISLLAQASLNKKEIDIELSKKIVKNFVKSISREVSIEYIQKTVCEHFDVPVEELKERTRKRAVVQARQLSMFLAKNFTKNSLKVIGKYFGGRDTSAVIQSCQAIQNLMDTDSDFLESVKDIEKKIQLNMI